LRGVMLSSFPACQAPQRPTPAAYYLPTNYHIQTGALSQV
jgi:hypothetical protein